MEASCQLWGSLSTDFLLFLQRSAPASFSDDDSALVKAYDNAVQSFQVICASQMPKWPLSCSSLIVGYNRIAFCMLFLNRLIWSIRMITLSLKVQISEEDSGDGKQDGTVGRPLQTPMPHKPASASTTVSKVNEPLWPPISVTALLKSVLFDSCQADSFYCIEI